MQRLPFPAHLTGRSFLRGDAAASGVHDGELRRSGLAHPAHGIWCPSHPEGDVALARAALPLLGPGWAYSHVTAARHHELPVPHRLAAWDDLHVMAPTEDWRPRRPGWVGHRGAESREVLWVDGLPVTGLLDTWCDLAEYAVGRHARMGADDLVVLGDEILNRLVTEAVLARDPWERPTQPHLDPRIALEARRRFVEVIEGRVRPRGKRAMTAALELMRPGVRSPQESRARLVFAHAGFPEPTVNLNLFDDAGVFLAESDLVWRERKVLVEYQGGYHAGRLQRDKDAARFGRLQDAGWTTHEMWAEDCPPGTRRQGFLTRVATSLGIHPADLLIL